MTGSPAVTPRARRFSCAATPVRGSLLDLLRAQTRWWIKNLISCFRPFASSPSTDAGWLYAGKKPYFSAVACVRATSYNIVSWSSRAFSLRDPRTFPPSQSLLLRHHLYKRPNESSKTRGWVRGVVAPQTTTMTMGRYFVRATAFPEQLLRRERERERSDINYYSTSRWCCWMCRTYRSNVDFSAYIPLVTLSISLGLREQFHFYHLGDESSSLALPRKHLGTYEGKSLYFDPPSRGRKSVLKIIVTHNDERVHEGRTVFSSVGSDNAVYHFRSINIFNWERRRY